MSIKVKGFLARKLNISASFTQGDARGEHWLAEVIVNHLCCGMDICFLHNSSIRLIR